MTTHTAITDYYAGATLDNGSLLCHRTTDATVKTASATAETSSGSGVFTAVFADVAAGRYRLKLKSGGEVVATRDITFAGTDNEIVETGVRAELDPASLRSALGMSAADLDDQLDAVLAASGGAGTGARTVTITVNDGTTALQNAVVRLSEGLNTYRTLTNASGVAVFNLDDATYTVAVTKSGYTYAGTTMIVNGTETATYSMTAISLTPGTGEFTTGFLTAYDETGTAEVGALIYCELTKAPSGDTGFSYDSKLRTLTSIAAGLVEIPGLIKGGTYRIWRGTRNSSPTANNLFLIPTSAGSTYELPSHIGRE